jgi:hypothetical protein
MRFLKGSSKTCLSFTAGGLKLEGFVNADLAGDVDSRKSTTGYVYILGGTVVSWSSTLQKIIAFSTIEAEYVAVSESAKEIVWLQSFLKELGKMNGKGTLYSDSQSAIFFAKNPVFHSRTKHIQIKYHFIRQLLDDEQLMLEKVRRSKNPADMLTKGVTLNKLKLCKTSVDIQG